MKYFENLSCEQKEKIDFGKINTIETFKGGKYSDEVQQVYYEMLCGDVSVDKCRDLLKKKLKMVNVGVDRVPGKSLTAEMLAEMEILSKVHAHEEVMKGSTNILHTHGTKYKFNEIGGIELLVLNQCKLGRQIHISTSSNIFWKICHHYLYLKTR